MSSCCAPGRDPDRSSEPQRAASTSPRSAVETPDPALATIPAGSFVMGTDDPRGYVADGEGPPHQVELESYRMGIHAVTNGEFAAFVDETAYRTTAEELGTSFVFS